MDYKRVTRRFVTPDQPVIELSLEDEEGGIETIGVTAEHPFRVKARGWIGAGALLPGDEVFTSTGGRLKVTGSTWLSKRQTVYNLEVEGYHTYFVGDVGAWVHNTCHVPASKKTRKNPFHYDKSSRSKNTAKKKAADAGSGPPEFDKGHNGGPDHWHPTNSKGERTGDTHYTWRKEWSKKRN